jgi:hypothetical protein
MLKVTIEGFFVRFAFLFSKGNNGQIVCKVDEEILARGDYTNAY